MNILITGVTSGIGLATAKRFAKEGHNLIITGRNLEKTKKVAQDLSIYNVDIKMMIFDVKDKQAIKTEFAKLSDIKIDVLVNNAGLAIGMESIELLADEDMEEMVDTNIKGLFYISKEVIKKNENSK